MPEVFADEQIKHREMLIEIAHPVAGTVPQVASPMRFKQRAALARAPAAAARRAHREILRELRLAGCDGRTLPPPRAEEMTMIPDVSSADAGN